MLEVGSLKMYDIQALKEVLHVGDRTILNYIRTGQLQARKVGSKWYVTEAELIEFLEKGTAR